MHHIYLYLFQNQDTVLLQTHDIVLLQNQDIEENNNQLVFAFGQQQLVDPTGIAISKHGKIFVSDSGANNIKVFQAIYTKQAISN